MSLLNTKVLPALNGRYETNVKSFEEVNNEQGGYVKVVLQLPDREYNYIIFPSQVEYVIGALRTQFEMQNETVTLADMLNLGMTKTFYTWFRYNQDIGRMNVAFHESKQAQPDNSEAPVEL